MTSTLNTVLLTDIDAAAGLLRKGGLVAFPTETVYGLGADATNPQSVARIFESKERPQFDPLIVHVPDTHSAQDLTLNFPNTAKILAESFWPGPLTIVLPKRDIIPDLVTAGLAGVGIRVPGHPDALELLRKAACPVAAPSANRFGCISPTTAQHVLQGLSGRIDAVLDRGPCTVGVESTVISLMDERPVLLRPGGLPVEDLEQKVGPVLRAKPAADAPDAAQPAPGMLSRHYAPKTRLIVIEPHVAAVPESGQKCGLLTWGRRCRNAEVFEIVEQLSQTDDLRTCALNLFAAMRSLDSHNLDVIIAHSFPNQGLGLALNDRLRRAACR